ncbi:7-cyano-7-deazaguanine synthase, partial [Parvimonas micra]|uniref:7-cyano-7-deazaguanine synthase n=2 Tax=Parvimonas micra TaxID=33033 RepID=UPI002B49727D
NPTYDGELEDGFEATIYCGVHADDGVNWAYPDCTPEFIGPMSAVIYTGTYNTVRVRAPLLYLTKPDVVKKGSELGVDYAQTWSCYAGEDKHCGVCPTCRSRKEAFELNGLADPTEYAV